MNVVAAVAWESQTNWEEELFHKLRVEGLDIVKIHRKISKTGMCSEARGASGEVHCSLVYI